MVDARDLERRRMEEMGLAHYKSLFDSTYLGSWDLGGRDVTLTIKRVEAGVLTGNGGRKTRKPVAYFVEGKEPKGLALNKTNCKTIASMYGPNTEDWCGKRVTLYATTTQYNGEEIECIRVRPGKPKAVRSNDRPEPNRVDNAPPSDRQPGDDSDEQAAAGGES